MRTERDGVDRVVLYWGEIACRRLNEPAPVKDACGAGELLAALEQVGRDIAEDHLARRADSVEGSEGDQAISTADVEDSGAMSQLGVLDDAVANWGQQLERPTEPVGVAAVAPLGEPGRPPVFRSCPAGIDVGHVVNSALMRATGWFGRLTRRSGIVTESSPQALLRHVRSRRSRQPEYGYKSFVDPPHLFVGEMADEVSKSLGIDRAELLHEHSSDVPLDVRLGPKRRWTGTRRGRSDDDDRARKKLVCLENHAVAFAVLLVPNTARQPEPVNVTALHAEPP